MKFFQQLETNKPGPTVHMDHTHLYSSVIMQCSYSLHFLCFVKVVSFLASFQASPSFLLLPVQSWTGSGNKATRSQTLGAVHAHKYYTEGLGTRLCARFFACTQLCTLHMEV